MNDLGQLSVKNLGPRIHYVRTLVAAMLISLIVVSAHPSNSSASGGAGWAKSIGNSGDESSLSMAVDGSGNVYTTGYFSGTVDFDPGPGTTNLTSAGGTDIYVLKMDSSGNLIYAFNFGNTGDDRANWITVDNIGNVYLTGLFRGSVDFDPGSGTAILSYNSAISSAFVLKLDSTGNYDWAVPFYSSSGTSSLYDGQSGAAIAVDSFGNVFATGEFVATTDFDPGPGTYILENNYQGSYRSPRYYGQRVYVVKLTSTGTFVWANEYHESQLYRTPDWQINFASSISIGAQDNVYFSYTYQQDNVFPYNVPLFTRVIELNSAGTILWSYDFSNSNAKVLSDSSGNIYVAGSTTGRGGMDIDPSPRSQGLTTYGLEDIFIVKIDSTGALAWGRSMGGTNSDYATSFAIDDSGNVYLTGNFQKTVDFDPGSGTVNLVSTWSDTIPDAYVQKLDSSGNLSWVRQLVGRSAELGQAIALDTSGSVYTTGYFAGTADFDPGSGTNSISAIGVNDIYIWKLNDFGNIIAASTTTTAAPAPASTTTTTTTAAPAPAPASTTTTTTTAATAPASTTTTIVSSGETGISINRGSPYTNTREVTLRIVWPSGASSVRISNDGGFSAATTSTFSLKEFQDWVLDDSTPGQHSKIVYIRFSGNGINTTSTYSDDILLDVKAPTVASSKVEQTGSYIVLTLAATDEESGLSKIEINNIDKTVNVDYATKVLLRASDVGLGASSASVRKLALGNLRIRLSDNAGNKTSWISVGTFATSVVSAPKVSPSKSATAKSLAAYAKLTVASTSKVSLKVAASSEKYCKVSGTTLKGVKAGSCKVTVTVTPKKGKAISKTLTLKVTK